MKSYIEFIEGHASASGKTRTWIIHPKGNPAILGRIAWFAPWRKYTFEAAQSVVFDQACLREIATFIETKTKEHRVA